MILISIQLVMRIYQEYKDPEAEDEQNNSRSRLTSGGEEQGNMGVPVVYSHLYTRWVGSWITSTTIT